MLDREGKSNARGLMLLAGGETVNYIKELNAFRDWLLMNDLPPGAIALWYTLLSINNMAGWKERFNAPNSTLEKLTGLSKQGLVDARRKLLDNNLIEYQKGTRTKAPIYKMKSLVKNMDNKLDQSLDSNSYQSDYQSHTNDLTIPKLNKNKQEEEEANPIRAYEKNFSPMTPLQMEKLWKWVDDFGNAEVVCMAVRETALVNPRVPFSYLERMLADWYRRKIFTVADVERAKKEHEANVLHLNKKKATGVDWDELERMIGDE